MKTYIATLYFQNIPIWSDIVFCHAPPDLTALNKKFDMFGDKLISKEIFDRRLRFKQFATV